MRAEYVPEPLVAPLADQVQVHLAEGGQPAVRVVRVLDVVAVAHVQPVVGRRVWDERGEQPRFVDPPQRVGLVAEPGVHGVRVGPQRPDHRAVLGRVAAQHGVRVVVRPIDQPIGVGDGRRVRWQASQVGRHG
jgi:hypothetical protein